MITSGPISAIDLHSSALMTRETTLQSSQSQLGPSIIRINLDYQGKREPFIYPVDRCNWYFVCIANDTRFSLLTLPQSGPAQQGAQNPVYAWRQEGQAWSLQVQAVQKGR